MEQNAPQRIELPQDDPHYDLHRRVREALLVVPDYFKSSIMVSGVLATDIFTLNTPLAAAIEEQTVDVLNDLRGVWDPDKQYQAYRFVRQPQTFPDVRFQKSIGAGRSNILMGIELKGWYLFAKEGEPSFRFSVNPQACALRDLLVVAPWALSNVISGTAQLLEPYVESARYAAEYRNWHWNRGGSTRRSRVVPAPKAHTYPAKADEVADHAASDRGGNFGRIARTDLLSDYVSQIDHELLSGIQVRHWRQFFKVFKEGAEQEAIDVALSRAVDAIAGAVGAADRADDLARLRNAAESIAGALKPGQPSQA